MKKVIRNIISFILPVTTLIIIPLFIEKDISIKNLLTLVLGFVLMLTGLYIMILTISGFITIGKGTLAPWSPTKNLVVRGIYRYVRNPMIMGVLIILIGESVSILSLNIFLWGIVFFILNHVYFMIYEEPNLEKRFGDEYREYKKNVPRWIPKLRPYNSD